MKRAAYRATIDDFLAAEPATILGELVAGSGFAVELPQRNAWMVEIELLQDVFRSYRENGSVYFEYAVPRLGKRMDVVAIIRSVVFVLEFKVGERDFPAQAIDQVVDYALDLKNFHEPSHDCWIAPILIATGAKSDPGPIIARPDAGRLFPPIHCTPQTLAAAIGTVVRLADAPPLNIDAWERGRYCPTPTIIEAAIALYSGHSVADISRNDASATNLTRTSDAIARIIAESAAHSRKSICFVTGVPGAGKTLVGLNIATQHLDSASDQYSVFLSGNGPLVAILRESLARDKVRREGERGHILTKGAARSEVKAFIQNVHHFRDDCLVDMDRAPVEHVAIFDEAQRAWDREQTSKFMQQKKGMANFAVSEPEFLISCLDRHQDWAVVVCLVGGGQEINTGEAGIGEWIRALERSYPHWDVHISPHLVDSEYNFRALPDHETTRLNRFFRDELHLNVSMRSFRAEKVSLLVKQLLDLDEAAATATQREVGDRYPIVLTRSLPEAKRWLRDTARGSERYGIVVSSQAQRLRPLAIDVRSPMDPIHWFLDGKQDVRSSYYLEDVATEFHVQGLELDYVCVVWDGDFRHNGDAWEHWSFVGDRWNRIRKAERQAYQKNAYRVLLTRARQGMIIVVPEGDPADPTRHSQHYDATYDYLRRIGFREV